VKAVGPEEHHEWALTPGLMGRCLMQWPAVWNGDAIKHFTIDESNMFDALELKLEL